MILILFLTLSVLFIGCCVVGIGCCVVGIVVSAGVCVGSVVL